MVAWREEDLRAAAPEGLRQGLDGLGPGPVTVQQVSGEEQKIAVRRVAAVHELKDGLALLPPPLGGGLLAQGGKGRVEVEVCGVQKFNHGETPFQRRRSFRRRRPA